MDCEAQAGKPSRLDPRQALSALSVFVLALQLISWPQTRISPSPPILQSGGQQAIGGYDILLRAQTLDRDAMPGRVPSNSLATLAAAPDADHKTTLPTSTLLVPSGFLTFYVDNVRGSDSNSGTDPATPFATISKVNSLLLKAGQTVAFRSGDEWHEMLRVAQSGSRHAPITFTSYGNGLQPIISAADTVSGSWRQCVGIAAFAGGIPSTVWYHAQTTDPKLINFLGQAGTPVASIGAITAPYQFYWDGFANLYVYSRLSPAGVVEVPQRSNAVVSAGASYVTFSGIEFRGAQTYDVYCGGSRSCSDWTFFNDTFNASYSNELYWQFDEGVTSGNLIVTGSTFKGGGSSGIKLTNGGIMDASITFNKFLDLAKIYNPTYSENTYADAIYGFSQSGTDQAGTYVAYNNIHDIGVGQSANQYGGGIHPDTVVGWKIEHNVVQNTTMPGVQLEKGSGSTARYNLIVNSGTGTYIGGLAVRSGEGLSASNHRVELNTVSGGYWACNIAITQNSGTVTMTNLTFRKNICSGAASGTQFYADKGAIDTGNTYTSNNFGVAATNFINFNGTPVGSYPEFDVVAGFVTGSIKGDPLFVNSSAGDYTLKPASPVKSAGAFPAY